MNFSDLLSHPSDSLSLFLPIPLSPSPPSLEFFGENETALGVRGDQILCSLMKNWYKTHNLVNPPPPNGFLHDRIFAKIMSFELAITSGLATQNSQFFNK